MPNTKYIWLMLFMPKFKIHRPGRIQNTQAWPWTGAWHIARHINLRRAIKKRRKFHSETNPITRYPPVHNRVSSFVCICAVFSCHLSCLRRRLKKPGARFHTLKTNEARFNRRASTSQGARAIARLKRPGLNTNNFFKERVRKC